MKKLLLIILALGFLTFNLTAQIVNIPDPNFKAELVGNSSINTNSDSEIQVSEATNYALSISVINKGISDLTGIEAFVNLTSLYCRKNNLTSLDLSQNLALRVLNCSSNQLTFLDLTNGNNINMSDAAIDLSSNSGLTCVSVDDQVYSTNNWTSNIDAQTQFSTFSCTITADFSGSPTTLCEGSTVSFTDASTNSPTSWNWSFTGGTPSSSTSQNPTITYNTAGTYPVTLTATNANGSDIETKTGYITVNGAPISSGTITGLSSPCENTTGVTYSISAITGATNYAWTVPTGATISSGQGTTAITINFGTMSGNVSVVPSNSCGSSTAINKTINIIACGTAPVAEFNGTPSTLCEGNTVSFSDMSTNTPTSWNWSFTGGTPSSSTSQNPTITYNTAGTYPVTLTATNSNGSDVETKIEYITVNSCETQLRVSDCGLVMTDYIDYILCDYVSDATEYEYEFVNIGLGFNKTVVRTNPIYRFVYVYDVSGIQSSTTYDVRVRAKVNGIYSPYGNTCQITTPANSVKTNLIASDCGITMNSYKDYITSDYVNGATEYEYEFVNIGLGFNQTILRTNSAYRFVYVNNVSGIQLNTTYDIRVRAKINGVFTSYGNTCQITTPASEITTQLRSSDCGIVMSNYSNYILCDYINGATEYEYEFVNTSLGFNQAILRTNPNYRFVYVNEVPGIQLNTPYDVRVRAKVNGVFTAYGSICQITSPVTARIGTFSKEENELLIDNVQIALDMIIYPNPNQGKFIYLKLQGLGTNTTLTVNDLSGRTILNQRINNNYKNYNETLRFNQKLNPGLYFVTVVSGNQKITTKLIVK